MAKYRVKRVCCMCKKFLGFADWESDKPCLETHGYCLQCYRIIIGETKK